MKKLAKKFLTTGLVMILSVNSLSSVSEAKLNGYYFKNNGVSITMGSPAASFLKKAGKLLKPRSVKKGCAFGTEYAYKYENFWLYTYSKERSKTEYVYAIKFLNDKVKTAEGIKIGTAESKLAAKYGKDKALFGIYHYKKGNTRLDIEIKNAKVKKITYLTLDESKMK